MKIVDLSHTMSIHTPGWVGYAGNKMYYAQNLQTVGIVAQPTLGVDTYDDYQKFVALYRGNRLRQAA